MAAASRFLAVVALALLAMAARPAAAERWSLDPVHTRIAFAVDHAGLSQALGAFSGVRGTLDFSEGDWASARVALTVELATLDLGDGRWQDNVLDGTFLAANRHPQARFVSTRVEAVDAGRATVHGRLTLRGVEREIALDVRLHAVKRHPLTRRRTAGFAATARLDRRDFGIDAWPNVVGHAVELRIEVEATLDPDAPFPTDEDPADAAAQHR